MYLCKIIDIFVDKKANKEYYVINKKQKPTNHFRLGREDDSLAAPSIMSIIYPIILSFAV
jgi:hypothetical protein